MLSFPLFGAAELRPLGHNTATAFEEVTSAIGRFYLVSYGMRQRHLGDLAREVCTLGHPVAK